MAKINYGVAGIRQRDYRVWIAFENADAGELDFVTAVDALDNMFMHIYVSTPEYEEAKAMLDLVKENMYHVGEMRADSIDVSVQDGDSIDGNEKGKIVLGKSGTFTAELINSTPEIIEFLTGLDGHECVIMLEEINDTRLKSYDGAMLETHEIIVIGNVPAMLAGLTDNVGCSFSFSEKAAGKNIIISTLNVEKSISTVKEFRSIEDLRYEEPINETLVLDSFIFDSADSFEGDFTFSAQASQHIKNIKVEVSDDLTFANIVAIVYVEPSTGTINGYLEPESGTTYHCRISGLNSNNVQKTPYSNVMSQVAQ
ncbi:MAG: hypothetical protein RBT65_17575 [Methanolobus sp.]|nr:hypothetical protein [Methanolobus sp.]